MTTLDYRSPEWVAEQLGFDKATVYTFLQSGQIPAVRIGKKWFISEATLRDFLDTLTAAQTSARKEGTDMPTDKWLATRRQVKFYLDAQVYEELKAALNGRPAADMLRDAVQAYIRNAPVGSQDDRHAP